MVKCRVIAESQNRKFDPNDRSFALCREMSSPEAEALVISTDPLHVRFQIRFYIFHSPGEVACKFDTGAVSLVLPGNYLIKPHLFNQPDTISQSSGG